MVVISVGGAVNTIYLQSLSTTHNVDFFSDCLAAKDYEVLLKATRKAIKKDRLLRGEWLNNRTVLFMPRLQRKLCLNRQCIPGLSSTPCDGQQTS